MYSAIGFLVATVLALLLLPAVWRRAVRLTRKRIEAAIPVSVAEALADKDQQRAAFAVDLFRAEQETEKLRVRTSAQAGEVARQAEEVRTLRASLEQISARLETAESENAALTSHRDSLVADLETRTQELAEARTALSSTASRLDTTSTTLEATAAREEELKIEHVALTTLRDTLKERIGELDRHLSAANALLASERNSLRATSDNLTTEGRKSRELADQLSGTNAKLSSVEQEADTLRIERDSLKIRLVEFEDRTGIAETARTAAEDEARHNVEQAREAQQKAEQLVRDAVDTIEMLRAEKVMLDGALAKTREDRDAIQARLDHLGPMIAAQTGENDDVTLLRTHIQDIAAEVANLTARLEGPGSPVDALLAHHIPAANGASPSLADRILALRNAPEIIQTAPPLDIGTSADILPKSAPKSRPRKRAVAASTP